MLIEMWGEASLFGKLGAMVAAATLLLAAYYAWRPSEGRLSVIRPLSIATIFAGLASFAVSAAIVLEGIAVTPEFGPETWRAIAAGTSETFVQVFFAFGCLTLTWILVAVGLRRAA